MIFYGICLLSGFTPNQEAKRQGCVAVWQRARRGLTAWWPTLLVLFFLVLRTSEASRLTKEACLGSSAATQGPCGVPLGPNESRALQPYRRRLRHEVVACPCPRVFIFLACLSLPGASGGYNILFAHHLSVQSVAHSL